MNKTEYDTALQEAFKITGHERVNKQNAKEIAMLLPFHILEAIVEGRIVYDDFDSPGAPKGSPVPWYPFWTAACTEVMPDKILLS